MCKGSLGCRYVWGGSVGVQIWGEGMGLEWSGENQPQRREEVVVRGLRTRGWGRGYG